MKNIEKQDPELYQFIKDERQRQEETIELIPSENFVSPATLEALGSVLTNKYSEGYPGKRYYGGNEHIDKIEQLAIDRAKELFGAEHANVQPLSGAPANMAAYFSILKTGDTILSMALSDGGHLTHGHPVTHLAKIFNFIHYPTTATGEIDYEKLEEIALEKKPKLILAGYSSYSREIDFARIKEIADKIGAYTMADIAHPAGLIAAGLLNSPIPHFDIVTTTTHKTLRGPRGGMILCKKKLAKVVDKSVFPGLQGGPHENNIAAKAVAFAEALKPEFKEYAQDVLNNAQVLNKKFEEAGFTICFGKTENHLLLLDLRNLEINGKEAQELLDSVNITVNMNVIPKDPNPPMKPSGIRLGSPAVTSRGMKENEMEIIADLIIETLKNKDNTDILKSVKNKVIALSKSFPLNYESYK